MEIDISPCKNPKEVETLLRRTMQHEVVVRSHREARRWFRANAIEGRMRARSLVTTKKEYSGIGPLHRRILMFVDVHEYSVDGNDTKIYSWDIVTY